MVFCHTRITHEDDDVLSAITLWCRSISKIHLCVQEVSQKDKKHIHMIHDTLKTISSFGTNLRKQFPFLTGNGSHASAPFKKTYDDNILYCCKGSKNEMPHVLYTCLDPIVIEQAHKKYWLDQEKFLIEHGVKPEDKKKKERVPNFIDKVIAELSLEEKRSYSYHQSIYKPTDNEIIKRQELEQIISWTCIKNLGKHAKVCDDNIVTRLINGVRLKCVTDYGNKEELDSIVNRFVNRVSDKLI